MAITFKKAVKHESFLRMAIAGPAGSGKTFTALTLAHALAGDKPVAVIDTERGSVSKYADMFSEFDVVDFENFNPNNYIEAILAAEKSGYGVLVIDSLSHAWNGPGGLLEMVENFAKRNNNKTFNAWGEATPLQNKLVDAITRARLHIICTMRTKTEYVVEINAQGKSVPRKVGTAPIQRADIEYEFDVYADMDADNTMIVHKSRCPQLSGAIINKPDSHVADLLIEWLRGVPAPARPISKEKLNELYARGKRAKIWASLEEFSCFVQSALQSDNYVVPQSLTEEQYRIVETCLAIAEQEAS